MKPQNDNEVPVHGGPTPMSLAVTSEMPEVGDFTSLLPNQPNPFRSVGQRRLFSPQSSSLSSAETTDLESNNNLRKVRGKFPRSRSTTDCLCHANTDLLVLGLPSGSLSFQEYDDQRNAFQLDQTSNTGSVYGSGSWKMADFSSANTPASPMNSKPVLSSTISSIPSLDLSQELEVSCSEQNSSSRSSSYLSEFEYGTGVATEADSQNPFQFGEQFVQSTDECKIPSLNESTNEAKFVTENSDFENCGSHHSKAKFGTSEDEGEDKASARDMPETDGSLGLEDTRYGDYPVAYARNGRVTWVCNYGCHKPINWSSRSTAGLRQNEMKGETKRKDATKMTACLEWHNAGEAKGLLNGLPSTGMGDFNTSSDTGSAHLHEHKDINFNIPTDEGSRGWTNSAASIDVSTAADSSSSADGKDGDGNESWMATTEGATPAKRKVEGHRRSILKPRSVDEISASLQAKLVRLIDQRSCLAMAFRCSYEERRVQQRQLMRIRKVSGTMKKKELLAETLRELRLLLHSQVVSLQRSYDHVLAGQWSNIVQHIMCTYRS